MSSRILKSVYNLMILIIIEIENELKRANLKLFRPKSESFTLIASHPANQKSTEERRKL